MRLRSSSMLAIALVASAALPGCRTKLTKRHRYPLGQVKLGEDAHKRTEMLLNLLEIETKTTRKSVFELTDRGQAAYFKALGEEVDGKSDFIAGARAELTLPPKDSSVIDKSKFKRRVVTGLRHTPFLTADQSGATQFGKDVGFYYPADRVVWSDITIQIPPEQPFRIRGYDKVDTGYETVDLGKLTRSANFSLTGTGELSASLGQSTEGTRGISATQGPEDDTSTRSRSRTTGATTGISGGGSLSGTVGETLTEEVQLRKRYVTMATSVLDDGKRLRVTREGVYGIDLTGAVTVDVEFEATKVTTSQVFKVAARPAKKKAKPAKPKPADQNDAPAEGAAEDPAAKPGITLTRKMKKVPVVREFDMHGKATSVLRHVKRRARTVTESDDRIEYLRSKSTRVSIRVRLDRQFVFPINVLVAGANPGDEPRQQTVWISGPKIPAQQVLFDTEPEAQHIAAWINEHLADLSAFKAYSDGFELKGEGGLALGKVVTAWVGDSPLDAKPEAAQ